MCDYDLGMVCEIEATERIMDLGEDPIIMTAEQLITLAKSFKFF